MLLLVASSIRPTVPKNSNKWSVKERLAWLNEQEYTKILLLNTRLGNGAWRGMRLTPPGQWTHLERRTQPCHPSRPTRSSDAACSHHYCSILFCTDVQRKTARCGWLTGRRHLAVWKCSRWHDDGQLSAGTTGPTQTHGQSSSAAHRLAKVSPSMPISNHRR